MKRSPIRRRKDSPAQKYYAAMKADRDAWVRSKAYRCMYCGYAPHYAEFPPLQVHEIERRSRAPGRWANPINYLLLCEPDHAGPFATMPHVDQLAIKVVVGGRPDSYITELELADAVARYRKLRSAA